MYGKKGTTISESVTIGNAVCELGMAILAIEYGLLVAIMAGSTSDGPQMRPMRIRVVRLLGFCRLGKVVSRSVARHTFSIFDRIAFNRKDGTMATGA